MSLGKNSDGSNSKVQGLSGFLMKSLKQKYHLLSRNGIKDFDFSTYHYSPYSSEESGEAQLCIEAA